MDHIRKGTLILATSFIQAKVPACNIFHPLFEITAFPSEANFGPNPIHSLHNHLPLTVSPRTLFLILKMGI